MRPTSKQTLGRKYGTGIQEGAARAAVKFDRASEFKIGMYIIFASHVHLVCATCLLWLNPPISSRRAGRRKYGRALRPDIARRLYRSGISRRGRLDHPIRSIEFSA